MLIKSRLGAIINKLHYSKMYVLNMKLTYTLITFSLAFLYTFTLK